MGPFHTIWSFGLGLCASFLCLLLCFLYLLYVEKIEAIDDALEDYVRLVEALLVEAREDDTDEMDEMEEMVEDGESARPDCVWEDGEDSLSI